MSLNTSREEGGEDQLSTSLPEYGLLARGRSGEEEVSLLHSRRSNSAAETDPSVKVDGTSLPSVS